MFLKLNFISADFMLKSLVVIQDTVVRWSAAKGIGRVTSRLTYTLSDEVLSSILELFSPGEVFYISGCPCRVISLNTGPSNAAVQQVIHLLSSIQFMGSKDGVFFSLFQGDGSWHGGCMALAELARRGLLLPISFAKVVPVVVKVLLFFSCYLANNRNFL